MAHPDEGASSEFGRDIWNVDAPLALVHPYIFCRMVSRRPEPLVMYVGKGMITSSVENPSGVVYGDVMLHFSGLWVYVEQM